MSAALDSRFVLTMALAALGCASAVACGDDADGGGGESSREPARYLLSSSVSTTDGDSSLYVSLLDSVGAQQIDYQNSREFAGQSDVWVRDGYVYVSSREALTITKYAVEGRNLVEKRKLSFASYGMTDFGFWLNTFISPQKAYLDNGVDAYIIWNPDDMSILGTLKFPELEERAPLMPFSAYTDRAAHLRDGKLYQPIYWTDDTYFRFAPDSAVAVFDVEQDELLEVLEVPCPGIDYTSENTGGDLYFSTWIFAPGAAALLDQPATCVAKLERDGSTIQKAFDMRDISDGRDGGAFRLIGADRALFSALHPEHAEPDQKDAQEITYGGNWRFWTYDLASGEASAVEAIDWNAGAAYSAEVEGKPFMLVPSADYAATKIYDLSGDTPVHVFDATGWSLRLFEL